MKRRNFVKNITLASAGAPFILNNLKFQAIGKELFSPNRSAEDKVLIIIRLGGGNDGLNTVIPLDQYDNLVIQRPNIIIPEPSILTLNSAPAIGLHPCMTGMQSMFNSGKAGIIQNVGYPEQNRSHFRSMDIWNSGLMDPSASTGWMGRNMDQLYPNFPDDYPNVDYPDPFAISMGDQVSATCQGLMGNFSHSIDDPTDNYQLNESTQVDDGTYYGSHMEYLSTLIAQTNAYGNVVESAVTSGQSLATYDALNPLAVQLKNVAKMISGGLKTKVYILNVDGFDTHDAQVTSTDVTAGNHTKLLKRLSDAIKSFQDDLALLNLENRVAGMTYSEFGRQIASNASLGTDHGDAAPLFLFGTCIGQLVVGPNPVIGDQIVDQAGIPMQIDFRDVYASVLKNWFEIPEADVQDLFEHQVTFYGFLNGCSVGLDENSLDISKAIVFPNPASSQTTVRFMAKNEWTKVEIHDVSGKLITVVCDGNLSENTHAIPVDLSDFTVGEYIVSIKKKSGRETVKFIKYRSI
jgi:uncharacterized protein (DUF1501 family)